GWDVVAVAQGALTGSARVERGVWQAALALREGWEEAPDTVLIEERELVLAWLQEPQTRLLMVEGEWAHPTDGAGRHRRWVEARGGDHAGMGESLRGAVVA